MTEKPKKLLPALISGAGIFLLSSIPYVNLVNIACCAWALVGGVVAAVILVRRSPVLRVTNSDGAAVGALSGVFGSLLVLAIDIPLLLNSWHYLVANFKINAEDPQIKGNPQSYQLINNLISYMERKPVMAALSFWLVFAIIAIGMATLGGLIGVAIFEKRKTPPQGPPDYPPSGYPPQGPPPGYPPQGQPPYGGQTPPQGQPPYGGDTPPY